MVYIFNLCSSVSSVSSVVNKYKDTISKTPCQVFEDLFFNYFCSRRLIFKTYWRVMEFAKACGFLLFEKGEKLLSTQYSETCFYTQTM